MKSRKRIFKEGDIVYLMTSRYVKSCGYEHTIDTALKELAVEAGMTPRDIEISLESNALREDILNRNPAWTEGVGKLKEALLDIQKETGMLGTVFNVTEVFPQVYDDLGWSSYMAKRIVSDMAYKRLRGHVKEGNERKLFFGEVRPVGGYRFPRIKVSGKRIVVTGTYYPAEDFGTYEERDITPAGLANRKVHLLLTTDPYYDNATWGEFVRPRIGIQNEVMGVLAEDCVHEDDLKVMDKLKEDPAAIRA